MLRVKIQNLKQADSPKVSRKGLSIIWCNCFKVEICIHFRSVGIGAAHSVINGILFTRILLAENTEVKASRFTIRVINLFLFNFALFSGNRTFPAPDISHQIFPPDEIYAEISVINPTSI